MRYNRKLTSSLDPINKRLPTAKNAQSNSYQGQHNPTCLPNTRADLLQEIYDWADGEQSPNIFWLSGLAGTGKSTIARTLVAEYSKAGGIAASFFFSRDGGADGHLRHAGRFVTSIAVQLANNVQPLRRIISDTIDEHSDIADRTLREQWRRLILGPLSTLANRSRYILVVDALDECEDEKNIRIILQLLAEVQSSETVRLRVFLTSRPEVPIRNGFIQMADAKHQDFVLHNISSSIVSEDIRIFFQDELKRIAEDNSLRVGWPGEKDVEHLVQSASGLFIWAATACRFIEEGRYFAGDRLSIVLQADSVEDSADEFASDDSVTDTNDSNPAVAPDQHLDELYIAVLQNSVNKYKKPERKKWRKLLGRIIGTIAVLSSPLSTQSLRKVLDTTQGQINQALNDLHAILDIPKDITHPLRLHHPSFRDFLLDGKRCKDLHFAVDEKRAHQDLATKCIQLMSKCLKQDICAVGQPGAPTASTTNSQVEQCLPPDIQYACLYWVQHIRKSCTQLQNNDQVHQFLQEHLLHWFEAFGWIRKVSEGIRAIISLGEFIIVGLLYSI